MPRPDGRETTELRPLSFQRGFVGQVPGSCLVAFGRTRILCTLSVENSVPQWLKGRGEGWLTAEYAMLPGSTGRRKSRDGRKGGHVDGRTVEIQRLIGRSLRPAVDRKLLGERTLYLDCDVIEADGGTRTAAINGAMCALHDGLKVLGLEKAIRSDVGAVSVGVVDGEVRLDLAYAEDSTAESDMNIVMDEGDRFLEIQGSAEGRPFSRDEFNQALDVAAQGIQQIIRARDEALATPLPKQGAEGRAL